MVVNYPRVIFINGASNSGKSTVAKELQNSLSDNYLHLGIDSFIKMMPQRLIGKNEQAKPGFYWEMQDNGSYKISAGVYGKRVIEAFGVTGLTLLKKGFNLIIDDVCYGRDQLQFYANLYKDYKLYFVGVYCRLEVILHRESLDNQTNSTAKSEIELVHKGIDYDLVVDTGYSTPLECAEDIAESIYDYCLN